METPYWLAGVIGLGFLFIAVSIPIQHLSMPASMCIGILGIMLMCVTPFWIAFGPGERAFGGTFGFLNGTPLQFIGEWIGRAAFGFGCLVILAILWANLKHHLEQSN